MAAGDGLKAVHTNKCSELEPTNDAQHPGHARMRTDGLLECPSVGNYQTNRNLTNQMYHHQPNSVGSCEGARILSRAPLFFEETRPFLAARSTTTLQQSYDTSLDCTLLEMNGATDFSSPTESAAPKRLS